MIVSIENKNLKRYDLLDLGRFFAAFSVVMYHFVFQGWTEKAWYIDFTYGDFWKYGFLGVQFFFIISGFVVFMSAKHKTLAAFLASRIARLYPAYWICVLVTFFLVWLFTAEHKSLMILFINFTMFEGFIKIPYVDPVYWSLTFELVFYFWIACFLFFNCSDKTLKVYLLFFMALSTLSYAIKLPNVVIIFCQSVYAPYFIAGICFYYLSEQKSKFYFSLLIWCYLLSLVQINHQLAELSEFRNIHYSNVVSFSIISFLYIYFLLVSLSIVNIKLSWAVKVGALTYPLYLIHMEVGSAIFGKYHDLIDHHILLIVILFGCMLFSYLVSQYVENIFSFRLKSLAASFLTRVLGR